MLCCPGWSAWQDHGSLQPPPPSSSDSCAPVSLVSETKGAHHHVRLIFVFLVEMGFCHVGQASLELLSSSDPLSQSAGITGVSHHTQPGISYEPFSELEIYVGTRENFREQISLGSEILKKDGTWNGNSQGGLCVRGTKTDNLQVFG